MQHSLLLEFPWFSYSLAFLSTGSNHRRHPGSQPDAAAGQRARPPETLQQESSAHGLDQEKRTLQQPIGPHLRHTHTQSNQTDFLKIIIIILKKSSSFWVNYSFYYALHAIITQILCYKMSYYQEKCICQ